MRPNNQLRQNDQQPPEILIIDDEPKSAELLADQIGQVCDLRCSLVYSGVKALEQIESENYAIVISDKNMPEVDGLSLLKSINAKYPDIILILLTGYPDLEDLANAVNECGISYYISKPWQIAQLKIILDAAVRRINLSQSNIELMLETEKKNLQISKLNKSLEKSFIELTRLLSDIMTEAAPDLSRHSRQVASLTGKVAAKMQLSAQDAEDLEIASLFHDIGLIGLPHETYLTAPQRLSGDLRALYLQHPQIGVEMLKAAPRLNTVCRIILNHHENIDGSGIFGMVGDKSPLPAQILRVCDFYDESVTMRGQNQQFTIDCMKRRERTWFNPDILRVFLDVITGELEHLFIPMTVSTLKSGMKLGKDICSKNGHLVMVRGSILTPFNLKRLKIYNQLDPIDDIYIVRE